MRVDGFSRRDVNGISFYSCDALEELQGLHHGFSTRMRHQSAGPECHLNLGRVPWDLTERVADNRAMFLSAVGLQNAHLATLNQIHSDRVHIIEENGGQWNRLPDGDALATRLQGVAVAVQVADCLPILIADPEKGAIAAVHSGWRGTMNRVFSKTIGKMMSAFGSRPQDILIAIGPGIRTCCFEVGAEVVEGFKQEFPGVDLAKPQRGRPDKYHFDLRAALNIQIEEAGIDFRKVFDIGACTYCHPEEFFSYRREGSFSGRMMGVIGMLEA